MRIAIRLGLVAALAAGITWGLAHAQAIEGDPCRQACYEEHTLCVDACSGHGDPIQCEARCRDQLEDCLRGCR